MIFPILSRFLRGHQGTLRSASFSPNGQRVLSADGTARVWDVASGSELYTYAHEAGGVRFATFSPDDSRVATIDERGRTQIFPANLAALLEMAKNRQPIVVNAEP